MSFIDDHTRKVWVYFMKHKGEVFQHFLNFKAMVEKEKGVSIKHLRSNGRGEYFSNEFSEYLKEHGIQRKYSCSYSPQQNGVVERKNRHIAEITCAMLNEKNLPNYFWVEAVVTIFYIMNQTPIVAIHGMTPKENSQAENLMFHTSECLVHCIRACSWRKKIKTRPKSWEMYLHWIFFITKRI